MKRLFTILILASAIAIAQQTSSKNSVALTPPPTMQVGQAFEHQILVLDGLKCSKCFFKNLTFLYSGGEYDLRDATFSGTIQIELHGAAENAMVLTSSLTASQLNPRKQITFATPKALSLKNAW